MSIVDGKTVLVTGGTGSIGTEIVRALLKRNPKEVRVLARSEASHYKLMSEFKQVFHSYGDVSRVEDMRRAAKGVDFIIHAAAMKHVPECEKFPIVACRTNIQGALNVLDAALYWGVERVVGVSTDKACLPSSVMGTTKLLMEKMFAEDNRNCVRLGNVVPSVGSVFPLWRKQINGGGPVTITDPAMTRFLIRIQDAAEFILACLEYAEPGEIWIPRIKAASMIDVANTMIGHVSVGYKVIGPRPGEITHERMFSKEESLRVQQVNDHFVLLGQPVSNTCEFDYISNRNLMSGDELAKLLEGV